MGDCPERVLCHVLVSFLNIIHFKLLKISWLVGGPASDPRKNFLTDFRKLNLGGSFQSVITEALKYFNKAY